MDGREIYTKKKLLIIQKKNNINKRLCGKRIYRWKRGDMDRKEIYTKKKPLIDQKKNNKNKRLCGKRIYR